jgi:hypothetical protein
LDFFTFPAPENSPFSLLKKPLWSKLEEEGKPSGFSPPPPFFCCNGHLPLLSFSLFERSPFSLEFSLDLTLDLVIDLSLTLNIQQDLWSAPFRLFPALERLLHHHNGRICVGLKTGFFHIRSAPIHQPKPDTRLSAITIDVPAPRRTPQWFFLTTTRRSVVHKLLRVDLTRRSTRYLESADAMPRVLRSCCCVLSFFLYCFCPFCLVLRCFGVDFLILFWFTVYFLFPFGSFFSTVTFHLNLHGVFGRLFRCLNGVFGLPMVVSIIVCAAARVFLGLHSCHFFSLLASESFLVRVLAILLYCTFYI